MVCVALRGGPGNSAGNFLAGGGLESGGLEFWRAGMAFCGTGMVFWGSLAVAVVGSSATASACCWGAGAALAGSGREREGRLLWALRLDPDSIGIDRDSPWTASACCCGASAAPSAAPAASSGGREGGLLWALCLDPGSLLVRGGECSTRCRHGACDAPAAPVAGRDVALCDEAMAVAASIGLVPGGACAAPAAVAAGAGRGREAALCDEANKGCLALHSFGNASTPSCADLAQDG